MRDNPPGQGVVEREYTFYSQKMQALFCIFLYFMDTVEFAMNKTVFLCNMPQEALHAARRLYRLPKGRYQLEEILFGGNER